MTEIKMPSYTISITHNQLDKLNTLIKKSYNGSTLYIVTDDNVHALYQNTLKEALKDYTLHFTVVAAGEASKSIETYQTVIHDLLKKDINRDHLILAFGGGVVGDLTGFVAATLYRGIPFAQIPTTLLAQVDSSAGSKVAIDLEEGKNLLGAFYDPQFVFIDTHFLATLSPRQMNNGLAEIIKASLIASPKLYEKLLNETSITSDIIEDAIKIKKDFVLRDYYDAGDRMILNFGHTFGHAIERVHSFAEYFHGEAVAYGMLMALEVGIKEGVTPPALYESVKSLLLSRGVIALPLLKKEDYVQAMNHDKKTVKDGIRFILISDVGKPLIKTMKKGELL